MNITTIVIIFLVICAIGYVVVKVSPTTKSPVTTPAKQPPIYTYTKKPQLMTGHELGFFKLLEEVAGERYYIFPQVHLSALFSHEVKGQNWRAAFRHINGRSVDYVLCDKITLSPVYAIELDDASHDVADRQSRDQDVERIFQAANLPLIRFRGYQNLTLEAIAERFYEAHQVVTTID